MTASGHSDLPGGQGNAYADDVTGNDPRIETGLSVNESFHATTGSGQKTATGHGVSGHEKRATGTMTVVVALYLLTANGERRESENDGDVHGSYSSVTELSYPSVLLDPKIGNNGRIIRGGETPKSLSIPHVVERAARNVERQPRQRRGKGESDASGQLPLRPLPKEKGKRVRAHAHQTKVQRHSHPFRWTEIEREGREPLETQHPASPAHLTGGKKKKRTSQPAKLPKEKTRGEKPVAQKEQSLKGEKASYDLCKRASLQTVPTAPLTNQHKCHKSFPWCKLFPYT